VRSRRLQQGLELGTGELWLTVPEPATAALTAVVQAARPVP
jgi:hypothetical protein